MFINTIVSAQYRRFIATLAVVLGISITGCSLQPIVDAEFLGQYALATIGNSPVPTVIDQQAGIFVIKSTLVLNEGGSYVASITTRIEREDEAVEEVRESLGHYRVNGEQITLIDTDSNVAQFIFDGSGKTLTGPGLPSSGLGVALLRAYTYVQSACCFVPDV